MQTVVDLSPCVFQLTQSDPLHTVSGESSQTILKAPVNNGSSMLSVSSSNYESYDDDSESDSPFVPPNHYVKKIRKLENKVKKLSVMKIKPNSAKKLPLSKAGQQKIPDHIKPLCAIKSSVPKTAQQHESLCRRNF